ncbi:hypothetical protein CWE08_07755 [Aliidiomarina iranensis]|uniref:TIGR04219 family outer membrane beta-barrel protein n=1 Tax=Aliidiomarina iranensis TaxID=1434071 RepID=A0A432VUZ9_9GAMM|nr:TIGR04219 family outer membrane beta-barrel protein [Aliidiomarina iranensis]RUO20356.1 hypothetical protein CWE08_07755 [Aliidiomarina iranensis]
MKKTLGIVVASSLAVISMPASADFLFSLDAEAQYWQADASGSHAAARTMSGFSGYDWDSSGQLGLSATFIHIVPFVPNVKIETQELKFTGDWVATSDSVTVDLGHETYTLFYAPLDNDLVELHVGASLKQIDGFIAENYGMTDQPYWKIDEDVFSAYLRAAVGLPFSGFAVIAEGHLGTFGDHDVYDFQGSVRYRFIDSLTLDGYVSLGYRAMKMDLKQGNDFITNYEFTGPFANVSLSF